MIAERLRNFWARRSEAAALCDERPCRLREHCVAAAECAVLDESLVAVLIRLATRARTLPVRRASPERAGDGDAAPGGRAVPAMARTAARAARARPLPGWTAAERSSERLPW
jgi:hypothetical protein